MIDLYDLDEDEKQHFKANVEWLAAANPDDWHRVALDFNWDEPLYLLYWIVQQDNCDIATALDIFWKGQPAYWLAEEGEDKEKPNGWSYLNRKMCVYIANRVRVSGYQRSEIAFSPDTLTRKDYVELVESEKQYHKPNIRAHPDLIQNRVGRKVDLNDDFYGCYPEEFRFSFGNHNYSAALEHAPVETSKSTVTWEGLEEIARELQHLPAGIKQNFDFQKVKSEAAYLVLNGLTLNMILVGMLLTALLTDKLSRFGSTIMWTLGGGILLYIFYLTQSNFKEILKVLHECSLRISKIWFAALITISLLIGGAFSLFALDQILGLREEYGTLKFLMVGLLVGVAVLTVARPVFRFLSKFLVDKLVKIIPAQAFRL